MSFEVMNSSARVCVSVRARRDEEGRGGEGMTVVTPRGKARERIPKLGSGRISCAAVCCPTIAARSQQVKTNEPRPAEICREQPGS